MQYKTLTILLAIVLALLPLERTLALTPISSPPVHDHGHVPAGEQLFVDVGVAPDHACAKVSGGCVLCAAVAMEGPAMVYAPAAIPPVAEAVDFSGREDTVELRPPKNA